MMGTDGTITKEQADAAIRALSGKTDPAPIGRLLKTTEAARLCGVTTKTLRAWTRAGLLVPVYGSGAKQRIGYTEASVRAFLEGRMNPAAKSADESATAQKVEG
jgi:hypothetical protein